MENTVTICFQIAQKLSERLQSESLKRGVDVDAVICDAIGEYLDGADQQNRRKHSRVNVDLSAVARPIGEEVGTTILPGKILDVSAGGLKLHCECDEKEIQKILGIGGQVEIIFTVPEREYPVCFTCEVKHVFEDRGSELGCEFIKSSGDSLDVLKSLIRS